MKTVTHQSVLSALVVLLASGALAQAGEPDPAAAPVDAPKATDSSTSSAASEPPRMEHIVVTAQKRSEELHAVPISISVLGGDDLKAQRIENYDDIARAVPGVSFNSVGANEGLTNIVIRGVSSTSGSATVGVYLDDVSITVKNLFRDGSTQPRIFDLERVEVLRGPQGTLYGDSSEGGTIRFVTKQPNLNKFSSEISTDVSQTEHGGTNSGLSASVNVPLIPSTLAVRGSFGYTDDSGYIDHYTQAGTLDRRGVNTERALVGRLTATWNLTDDLTVKPGLFYQRDKTGDNSAFFPTVAGGATVTSNNLDRPSLGLWQQNKQVAEPGDDTVSLESLTIEKGLGFADLTSVTGLFNRDFKRTQDGTFYNSGTFAAAFLDSAGPTAANPNANPAAYPGNAALNDSIIGNLPSPVLYSTQYRQFSQEFRLSSPDAGSQGSPLKWVGGLYYAMQHIHNTNFQRIPGINTAFQSIYGYSMDSPQSLIRQNYDPTFTVPQLFPNDIDESDDRTYNEKQYAVFGQIDYDFSPKLHAGLGLRYLTAKEDFTSTEIGFYQIGNISPYNQSATFHAFTPKATVSYDVSAATNIYGSVAKGFRLGGPTGPIVFGPGSVCNGDFNAIGQTTQPTKFGSDSLWTYELGAKSQFGESVNVNAAAFYTRWSNIQQEIYLPTCGYYFTENIGDGEIKGGELEATYQPIRDLTFGLTGSVEHAVITSSINPLTAPVGAHLKDVPEKTATASLMWQHPLPVSEGLMFSTRIDYNWTGHAYGDYLPTNPNYNNPAYGVLNASMRVSGKNFDVSFYAKNLANDKTIIQTPLINTVVEGYTVRPRTIGLTGRIRF